MLENPNLKKDLKGLSVDGLRKLSEELRLKIIDSVLRCGGHLASSLGAVDIIVALHFVFDFPHDKLIFDVGHQAYAHKLLTGRVEGFETSLRQFGGIGAFLKRDESEYDTFTTGHAGNSVSLALGMARARDLKGENYDVVSLVGDASIVNGMSFEALNDYGNKRSKHVIVLNDNDMSISRAVGAVSARLTDIRQNSAYKVLKNAVVKASAREGLNYRALRRIKNGVKYMFTKGVLFEEFGYNYVGPIDGHNIEELIKAFNIAKSAEESTVIHVVTKKGKGCAEAEQSPRDFHGYENYSIKPQNSSYSSVFGDKISQLAQKDKDVVVVCPAMIDGTGLTGFARKYRDRIYDVGIAEEHAVSLASGLARGGLKPYVAIYSTFLQRCVDQIIHDVVLQKLPVTICVDRAGIVGRDGETHQGIFDLSLLSCIPNLTILSPASFAQLQKMLDFSLNYDKPLVIRYPRGGIDNKVFDNFEFGCWGRVGGEAENVIVATGASMVKEALKCQDILSKQGVSVEVICADSLFPLDENTLDTLINKRIFVLEDDVAQGGLFSLVCRYYSGCDKMPDVKSCALTTFVEQGDVSQLVDKYELSAEKLAKRILSFTTFAKTIE